MSPSMGSWKAEEQRTSSSAMALDRRSAQPDVSTDPFKYLHGLTGVDQPGNHIWVNVLLGCFIGVCVVTLGLRLFKMGIAHMRHVSAAANPTNQNFWAENRTRWWPWLQRHLFMAPLWNKRHNQPFQLNKVITNGTLPGRFHVLLLTLYVTSNIAYCLVLPWNRPEKHSVIAALRGRSGMLAAFNLIPTVLFALRNNPLIPLLRVSYDDFNLLHRWCARIVIIESLVHTAAWFVNTYETGHWKLVFHMLATEASYGWGLVASLIFFLIAFQASAPVRHSFYETFLNVHRLIVLFGLIGVYVHLDTHKLPQVPWMQIIFTLWGLEYFFRLARICYYNWTPRTGLTRIKVQALPGEACRVSLTLARPWVPKPGCHVHMYMPKLALWSSHPFSIAWSDIETAPTERELDALPLPVTEKSATTTAITPLPLNTPTSKTIHLICRARTGFTRTMFQKASASPNKSFTTWGLAEGPYASHHSLLSYGTVLLFAGGVGITHQVMFVRHLLSLYPSHTTATRKIVLIWSIPDTECLEWIREWMDDVLRMEGRREVLRIMMFVTRPKAGLPGWRSASETVTMLPGRPNVGEIVEKEVRDRIGAMAVTVCGSGGFADGVRAAARKRVQDGVVDFVEEAFTY
ncbi:hypothetical protein GQ43DRAFT_218372 [Delitschia confertaspora ATCC 74209]|uniref:FAD-binding FR-type domain-containing protein n=1 Tax=Delitschia confertaspora ATCC 74209 TaxID=1513339 RepID=A0A9P4MY82_9PLEO|nr:hypothetical protein GQ43DRAFT_218372 [Delitschia confertaspora ATCC 74209]